VSKSTPPLDPRLLALFRKDDPAPAEVRARARQRVLISAAAVKARGDRGGGGDAEGGDTAVGARARTLGMPTVASLSGLAFLVGGAAGAALYAVLAPLPPPRIVYVDRIEAPPPNRLPAPPSTPAEVVAPPAAPETSATHASSASVGRASQLLAERMLLEEARAALTQGDAPRAIDRLDRHRRTYPVPLLGEERDAMLIEALVKAGRYDEARARAAAFRKHTPHSFFSPMVESALESIP
jgi:hypothetical protein